MEGSSHRNKISIHPPREGWDGLQVVANDGMKLFQSTHPVRGGTSDVGNYSTNQGISIHPPREGWDCLNS